MLGLVLEGGGAKGAFQCGAVKALYDSGFKFDGVAGTSIGAINGAMIVQDCGYNTLYDFWLNVSTEDFTEIDDLNVNKLINKDFTKDTIKYWTKQAINLILNRGLSADKLLTFLRGIINEKSVRKSPMDFALATYCITTMEQLELLKEEIQIGKLHEFIMASAYHPAFHLQLLDNRYYFDGGIFNNMPLNILPEKKHYDEIIAIRTMSKMPYKTVENSSVKINYICPSESLGTAMSVGKEFLNRKIKLGYYDAMRFIKKLNGEYYYFNSETKIFSEIFMNLNCEEKIMVCNQLKIKYVNYNNLIEKKLIDCLNTEKKSINCDGFTFFFETIAKNLNINKFKIYNQMSFLKELVKNQILKDNFFSNDNKLKKAMFVYKIIFPKVKECLNV